MSRIGKKPVSIPAGVTVNISDDNIVTVKGPKGELKQEVDKDIKVELQGAEVVFSRPTEQKRHKAMHGLYRSLIQNMVIGVSDGYKIVLELVGVGYRAAVSGNNLLELNLGYSHNIFFQIPPEISISAETAKGKSPAITMECADKQLIGHVAAQIRKLRKVEPYKGKGVRFQNEVVRRKAGKTAGK